ncbi:PAS domain-containing sensor histidine kinase [Deinococcus irradiatisoli]|uniref:histidine kinase n=1 Tax=Deinococcus irradiatisoli TaxID=2202254 RepID=A0A2Z3JJT3_9DEIO|nr:ATP-binding protein [Deinococcus irradiatisoli]AWN23831.1 PAS domain-containing sensor histidine kinase [Deinococcus irradiatisoli]
MSEHNEDIAGQAPSEVPGGFRRAAESQLRGKAQRPAATPGDTIEELQHQFQFHQHELQVHQIELTLQNEELRRSNAELELAQRRYQELYDLAPVGYVSLDAGGHILELNAAASRQLGVVKAQLLGRRFLLFTHEASRAEFAGFLDRLGRQIGARTELTLLRQGTAPFAAQVEAALSTSGEIRLCFTDISGLKEAQEAAEAINQTLEARVAARTEQVQELNAELESFVQATMQALDTPLRHITSFAALLGGPTPGASGALPGELQAHYLEEVVAAAEQVQRLTSALSDFFRLGQQPLRFLPVDLEKVVAEAKKALYGQAEGRPVHWTQDHLPAVTGDSRMLQLVFLHLLDNALKFSRGRSEARIHIGAQETEREHIVVVQDNGIGFNSRQKSRLFSMFQHLHSARQTSELGLGLGLASVRRIVLRHGGRVWGSAQEGEGACFWVALPKDPALRP